MHANRLHFNSDDKALEEILKVGEEKQSHGTEAKMSSVLHPPVWKQATCLMFETDIYSLGWFL